MDSNFQTGEVPQSELNPSNGSGEIVKVPPRNFSLFSICSAGIVIANSWSVLGGSITIALYNGGASGVLYEFIAITIIYCFIAASIAELASAVPSSAGVFHWAHLTGGPKYGRILGWFAGWWNWLSWTMATASECIIIGNIICAMITLYHPDFAPARWVIWLISLAPQLVFCLTVLYGNRLLPRIAQIGLLSILAGVSVTILVCAIMPSTNGSGHASSSMVWNNWLNGTGYSNQGLVFLLGMLNGAFSIGIPDSVSHLAEELSHPSRDIPIAIAAQLVTGFITTFIYLIALFYGVTDLENITTTSTLPLADIYQAVTNSRGATFALLLILLLTSSLTAIGGYITCGRTLWALARDGLVPFPSFVGKLHPKFQNQFNATLVVYVTITLLSVIYVGSEEAFGALVGSFIIMLTMSYLAAILPFLWARRFEAPLISPGVFQMSEPVGYTVNIIAVLAMLLEIVVFCFPYSLPVSAPTMNYASLICGGSTIFISVWWLVRRKSYRGPAVLVTNGVDVSETLILSTLEKTG